MASLERPHLTPEGKAELEHELENLRTVKYPQLHARISDMSDEGDVSDNSEYEDVRDELNRVRNRIEEIEILLAEAIVSSGDGSGTVAFGSTVTVVNTANGTEQVYRIVSPHEANPAQKRISTTSPVGAALLGKQVGDAVSVASPNGTLSLEIRDVR